MYTTLCLCLHLAQEDDGKVNKAHDDDDDDDDDDDEKDDDNDNGDDEGIKFLPFSTFYFRVVLKIKWKIFIKLCNSRPLSLLTCIQTW